MTFFEFLTLYFFAASLGNSENALKAFPWSMKFVSDLRGNDSKISILFSPFVSTVLAASDNIWTHGSAAATAAAHLTGLQGLGCELVSWLGAWCRRDTSVSTS